MPAAAPLSDLTQKITWVFKVALQGSVKRYGTLEGKFYSQFLPAGIILDQDHPPKRIEQKQYELAQRFFIALHSPG